MRMLPLSKQKDVVAEHELPRNKSKKRKTS